jgi:hypothetical protein
MAVTCRDRQTSVSNWLFLKAVKHRCLAPTRKLEDGGLGDSLQGLGGGGHIHQGASAA